MLERYRWVEQQVEKIQGRGGRVVFIRMPSSGEVRRIEFLTWPREKYWDQFAASIAAPAIHFEDYPSLSGFNCPDGSHLDENSARQFTRNLLKIL